MIKLDIDHLLSEISADAPCGENLEEDANFLLLENEAKFVEERQMGDSTIPSEEPDWKKVQSLALELLENTHDIQIALHLTCSLIRTDSFIGFSQGLAILKGWLEKYWDSVYPIQDPEDDYPVLRMNTLGSLNDYTLIRKAIIHSPLTQSAPGKFSWRQIEIAEGKVSTAEDEVPIELSVVEAAFDETDFATLKSLSSSVNLSLEQLKDITTIIIEKADAVNTPDFDDITSLLQHIANFLNEKVEQRQPLEVDAGDTTEGSANKAKTKSSAKKAGIHNRKDVAQAIDEICKYFNSYEPSSPVPFLLLRAKKLLKMDFMEILHDMTPDAINQAENICGIKDDSDNNK